MPPKVPTIRDVAVAAGVSRGTVSRVLNGGHYVSPAARVAVERAIEATGYVANHSARSLARRRTDCVAFILSEPHEKLFEDPNFDVLLRSAERTLAEHDRALILMFAADPAGHERVARYLRAGHVDGAMLVSVHFGDPLLGKLPPDSVPVVSFDRPRGDADLLPYIGVNNRDGAEQMTKYLIGRGHRQIATITGPLDTSSGQNRLLGYRDAMSAHGLATHIVSAADYGYRSGEAAMDRLLESDPDVDAVFVASDLLAAGALTALRRHGRKVPDDVAVGGFDDSRLATTTDPQLTTMRQPFETLAAEVARMLLRLIDGEPVESYSLPTELVIRASA